MPNLSRAWIRPLLGTLFCLWAALGAVGARPIVTTLAPISGAVGATVTITGTGFGATAAQNAVYFDAVRATITAASATQLSVTVPLGAAAAATVTVINTTDGLQGSSVQDGAGAFRVTFTGGGTLGLGSFRRTDVALGWTAWYTQSPIITADFNQDGKLDVLSLSNNVALAYGDGAGGFGTPVLLSAGFQPTKAAVADFTGDGRLDIVTLNYGSQDLSLLAGASTGGFAAAQTFYSNASTADVLTQFLFAQDFDSDGRVDLMVGMYSIPPVGGTSTSRYEMLRNTATGFVPAAVSLPGNAYPWEVDNLSADSRPDFIGAELNVPSGDSVGVRIWKRNTANTGYDAPEALPNVPLRSGEYRLAVADVDLDGRRDVVLVTTGLVQNALVVTVRVWQRNTNYIGFRPVQVYTTPGPVTPLSGNPALTGLKVADIDGDGAPDILLGLYSRLSVLRNNGTGTAFASAVSYNSSNGVLDLATGDFNGDGRTDILAHNQTLFGTYDASLFLNTGGTSGTNNDPTLNALADVTINEDSGNHIVSLSGISNGGEAGQAISITAVSSDANILPNPAVSYISPTATGSLRLRPAPDAFGTATVTVTVSDGQTQNGTVTRSFRVIINPVNDAPTLDSIPDIAVTPNGLHTVSLSGITAGALNETQALRVTGTVTYANNGTATPSHTVSYISPDYYGAIELTVNALTPGLYSTNTVTVTDADGASVTRTYRVYYRGSTLPGRPTIDPIANQVADRSLTTQPPVALTGIGDGDPLLSLPLSVTASSSDPSLVDVASLSYTSPASTASLRYSLVDPARSGTVTITVTVSTDPAQTNATTRTFTVTVPTVTATKAAPELATLQLFPNPSAEGRFTLKTAPVAGPATLSVFDALGREVWQQQLAAVPGQLTVQPTGLQPQGVYLVRLTTQRGTASRRLLVQ